MPVSETKGVGDKAHICRVHSSLWGNEGRLLQLPC